MIYARHNLRASVMTVIDTWEANGAISAICIRQVAIGSGATCERAAEANLDGDPFPRSRHPRPWPEHLGPRERTVVAGG